MSPTSIRPQQSRRMATTVDDTADLTSTLQPFSNRCAYRELSIFCHLTICLTILANELSLPNLRAKCAARYAHAAVRRLMCKQCNFATEKRRQLVSGSGVRQKQHRFID